MLRGPCSIPFPAFAPLPSSMVRHIALLQYSTLQSIWTDEAAKQPETRCFLEDFVQQLLPCFIEARTRAEHCLLEKSGLSDSEGLSLKTFVSYLDISVSNATLSRWSGHHVLRYESRGYVQVASAMAILIARELARDRLRGWLPASIPANEPEWWCWRQDAPHLPAVPCAVPILDSYEVPHSALLWTNWRASNPKNWLSLPGGSVRWASSKNVTYEDLVRWAPYAETIISPAIGQKPPPHILSTLSTLVLQLLAEKRLRLDR